MGLFDKRPPCAICGGKVKGLLPWKIEGNYICNDCYGVVDAQDGNSFNMKQFLEYRDFREQNHALKDQFHIDETVEFGFFSEKFVFDYQNNLFCMDKGLDRTIFHGSELESFLISEDGAPLLDENGAPQVTERVSEWDNSDYSLSGPITDNRDGTVSIKMGKPTDLEDAMELLLGGETV